MPRLSRSAFTLVELLVVIAIIGILVSLLLPAVQAAREAGRRIQCSNNLKQMGLGAQSHLSAHQVFPSGGWGWKWTGEPDKGFGAGQPGGWAYNILPYIEQQNLHDLGKGQSDSVRRAEGKKREETPVGTFLCPSRHRVRAYPYGHGIDNIDSPSVVCRCDYAGNAGDGTAAFPGGKCSVNHATHMNGEFVDCAGIVFQTSNVPVADIRDGTSKTLLIGERNIDPDHYEDGQASDNDQSAYIGHDIDVVRYANETNGPVQDTPGAGAVFQFGSGHSGIFQVVFCDGSVRGITYSIDMSIYKLLGNRKDGKVLDDSQL